MEYPIFDVPLLGGSLLIAKVAIFHAFIAHFSVGSGFFVALAERRAIREGDEATLAFLKKYALLILLVPYVLGTVTGAGIWFTVALVSPRAISVLIHQFVWDWAAEWVLFLIEVVSIFLYFFTWGRVRAEVHNRIGWVFAVASLLTLFIINAILSFMLTPGGAWLSVAGTGTEASKFWEAFFNPTYFPSLLMRTLACLSLAGIYAIITYSRVDAPELERLAALGLEAVQEAALRASEIPPAPISVSEKEMVLPVTTPAGAAFRIPWWSGRGAHPAFGFRLLFRSFSIAGISGLAAPGEILTCLGRGWLERKPPVSLLFSYCGGYLGYLMTPETFGRGGYEPKVSPGPVSALPE